VPYLPRPNAYEIAVSARPIGQRRTAASEGRGPALAARRRMTAPEVIWRSTLPDGSEAACVLVPTRPVSFVVWYLNENVQA
jgi:hypothetical protein